MKTQKKRKRSQKKPVKQADVPIIFVMPTFEVVGVSAKKGKLWTMYAIVWGVYLMLEFQKISAIRDP